MDKSNMDVKDETGILAMSGHEAFYTQPQRRAINPHALSTQSTSDSFETCQPTKRGLDYKQHFALPGSWLGKRLALALELEGVLIDCRIFPDVHYPEVVEYFDGPEFFRFYVRFRPGLFEFLEVVGEHFDLFLFTRSTQSFAEAILARLGHLRTAFAGCFSRKNCKVRNNQVLIDLAVLDRPLSQVILIDHGDSDFPWQQDNTINARGWCADAEGRELFYILYFLQCIQDCSDIRQYISYLRKEFVVNRSLLFKRT